MNTPVCVTRWKRSFLAVEVFVILAVVYGSALRFLWPYDQGNHNIIIAAYNALSHWLRPMVYSSLIAITFLLLASPFFLKSLHAAAIRAWVIGALALICFILLAFWQ